MNLHLDIHEEEQIEAIKRWWQENGMAVIVGISLGIMVIMGWKWYQNHTASRAENASNLYQTLLMEIEQKKEDRAATIAGQLLTSHPNTLYAHLTTLVLAGQDVAKGKLEEAKTRLQSIIDQTGYPQLQAIARLRNARILLSQSQFDSALALIDPFTSPAYQNEILELKGDIYLAQGKPDQARTQYEALIARGELDGMHQTWIQKKLDNLGSVTATPIAIPAAWQPLPAFGASGTQSSYLPLNVIPGENG